MHDHLCARSAAAAARRAAARSGRRRRCDRCEAAAVAAAVASGAAADAHLAGIVVEGVGEAAAVGQSAAMATWSEVMDHWAKGDFSERAGFSRDIHAERAFAPGCTIDLLAVASFRRKLTGPEGATEWFADKDDFDFGGAPYETVPGATADTIHQRLPPSQKRPNAPAGYCTWTIRDGMVHAFVVKRGEPAEVEWASLAAAAAPPRAAGDAVRVPQSSGTVDSPKARAAGARRARGRRCVGGSAMSPTTAVNARGNGRSGARRNGVTKWR